MILPESKHESRYHALSTMPINSFNVMPKAIEDSGNYPCNVDVKMRYKGTAHSIPEIVLAI
jgi:hypothetical protein